MIFRENIYDIINEWGVNNYGQYPVEIPGGGYPARNSGIVLFKCFINNVCPFYASSYKEDCLTFNSDTYEKIKPWLPGDLMHALSVTKGVEGIHFTPRKVFRHNYVYQKYDFEKNKVAEAEVGAAADVEYGSLFANFSQNYKEVNKINPANSSSVAGVDQTKYKPEQSWIVAKSIFDPDITDDDNQEDECGASAKWSYRSQKVSDSSITQYDINYDYFLSYVQEDEASWDPIKDELKVGQTLKIDRTHAQMPVQGRVRDSKNKGVHWRLIKRTPLFQKEDFFIRFCKQANDTVSNPNSKARPARFPEEFKDYWPLDVTHNELISMSDGASGVEDLMRKRNAAVSPPIIGNQIEDSKKFDFRDQAYYIIELGMGTEDDHYFIIIAERANPIFVHFAKGEIEYASKILSEFEEISGSALIHSPSFDITVRNHLGSLVIQFTGEGINASPWIVKRWDWVKDWDPVSQKYYLKDKVRQIFIPRGRMCIMGGNIRAGFLFGPLQYQSSTISMIYPPRNSVSKSEDMGLAFRHGSAINLSTNDDPDSESGGRNRGSGLQGVFKSSPFFLPSDGNHSILFSSTDIFLEDLGKNLVPVGEAAINQPLFMQEAQFYKNYYDIAPRNHQYVIGGFLYDNVMRDFSDASSIANLARTSNIVVKKYRYLNDPKTRQQAFDILIGMMAGDHVFTSKYWIFGSPPTPATPVGYDYHPAAPVIDNEWFLESCKTPIVTSIRLISYPSSTPRWSDGTITATGINFTPAQGTSPYFVDASDHVLSFSDSWSASGFSEMEHSGSINFLLDRSVISMNGLPNPTDKLLSLQNKTFYIEIWAGYQMPNNPYRSGHGEYASYSRQDGMYKLFTGLCHGGEIDYEYGKNIMSCKLEDYTSVLKGTRIFNSPWFDGVKDINCINEVLQMAGFRDVGKYDPGQLVRVLSNGSATSAQVLFHHFDGRMYKMEPYALPSGYNRLEQPAFKFNDGDPLMDIVSKVAKRAGKVFFFDQFGIAHYENVQDIVEKDFQGASPMQPLCRFTTNPELWGGQMVFNKLERDYDQSSVINHIKIMSTTPDFSLLVGDDLNWASMDNPEAEGFIGYLKTAYQQEGMFGSKEAMLDTIRKYSVAFKPKIKSKFETYGVPLRANDIIAINDETTRVVKVAHSIDASKNQWWMEVETEKYQIINSSRE